MSPRRSIVGAGTRAAGSGRARPDEIALSRRAVLRGAVGVVLGLALGGCRVASLPPTLRSEPAVELVYQDWRTEWFPALAQEMLARFRAEHPHIRVHYVPDPEDLEGRMSADMAAGTAPDLFQGCCAHLPLWAQKGHTLDLRPYVHDDLSKAIIDDWDAAQYRHFFTLDGRQYALPKYHGALGLYYNRDLFDSLGVSYPTRDWTYDDYHQAMRLLARPAAELYGSTLDVSWDRLQVHINAFGGHLVDPVDRSTCLMAEPPAVAALEWLRRRMWDERIMAAPRDVQYMPTRQAFVARRVTMVEDGSWALKDILAGAEFAVGVAPFPEGPARRVTLATTDGYAIYSQTRHPEEAWELLKFLTGIDFGRAMARAHLLQPARLSLIDEWVEMVREQYPAAAEMDVAAFADGQRQGYAVTTEVFADMDAAVGPALAAWERVFMLGEPPAEVMPEACRRIAEAHRDRE